MAAFEVQLTLERWGLSSEREASEFLGVSRRTLSKLNPKHPDGTLLLDSLDRIYAIFHHLVSFYISEKDQEAERNELRCSRSRILERSFPLPEKVRKRTERERGKL